MKTIVSQVSLTLKVFEMIEFNALKMIFYDINFL